MKEKEVKKERANSVSAPSYKAIPGVYWETRWFEPYGEYDSGRQPRPCENGMLKFFDVPRGERFKVCFLRREGDTVLPWAHDSFYPAERLRGMTINDTRIDGFYVNLRAGGTFYRDELTRAGFDYRDPLQWWVEIEEVE